jgi:hypothetical protein
MEYEWSSNGRSVKHSCESFWDRRFPSCSSHSVSILVAFDQFHRDHPVHQSSGDSISGQSVSPLISLHPQMTGNIADHTRDISSVKKGKDISELNRSYFGVSRLDVMYDG